jgi:phosphohistidine phosphatase
MLLYVMRHGPAEDRATTGRDFDRGLTASGHAIVTRAAQALSEARSSLLPQPFHDGAASGPKPRAPAEPLRVLSSPFHRARETAEIVVAALSPGALPVEIEDDLSVDAPLPLELVRRLARDGTDALLVGHQPIVEELARELVHPARLPLRGGFRTAVILTFEHIADDRWHPAALLDPYRTDPARG